MKVSETNDDLHSKIVIKNSAVHYSIRARFFQKQLVRI